MFFDLQTANVLKRISAWVLDIILLAVVATGAGFLISGLINYDAEYDKLTDKYAYYESEYGISLSIDEEAYANMEEADRNHFDEVNLLMNNDAELNYQYSYVMNLTLIILSLSLLFAYSLTEFLIPLIIGDGQTLGKKVFGICVMQKNHTKLRPVALAARTFLGKYAIETMIPALIVIMIIFGYLGLNGTIALVALIVLEIVFMVKTKTNSTLHDLISWTVAVDAQSQMIFADEEAMKNYKQKLEKTDGMKS